MSNFISHISISNFKSLKTCEIKDCKRINLFIGRPNVGKSNILEALSLFSIPYLLENTTQKLSSIVRLEHEAELFYNGDTNKQAIITTDTGECTLNYDAKKGLDIRLKYFWQSILEFEVDDELVVSGSNERLPFDSPIKKYSFNQQVAYHKSHAKYLIPPYGSNLLTVIENYKDLKRQVVDLFRDYGLDIVFDKASQTLKIIQKGNEGIFLIPYSSVADTLQRIIFYKAAILSNDNSILLFEEPEAHSFPPYMTHLTQEMIYKKDNQYFIATHSPFILNDLLENGREDLAVFIVHYEQFETKITKLDDAQMHEVLQDGLDIFTNSESFI